MKNVYDILLNYKKNAYEFYEWDKEDDIKHIKKICAFKVSDKCILDFLNNYISVDKDFLEKIKGKTELFSRDKIKILLYSCIIYSDNMALGLMFDNNGYLQGKSKMLFDEEEDVIFDEKSALITDINYKIISSDSINNNLTRKENKLISIISRYLNVKYEKREYDELKYFYYECFDLIENDETKVYKKLLNCVSNANYEIINKLKNLINVVKK